MSGIQPVWVLNNGIIGNGSGASTSSPRAKENLLCATMETREIDRDLPINEGIVKDEIVMPEGKIRFRRIECVDPFSGTVHVLITNQMTLSPGLLAQLYRIRWDIEKVFDEFKNSLNEQ